MSANNTSTKLPNESDTVPHTYFVKLESSSDDFVDEEKSSTKPEFFSAQSLLRHASTKFIKKEFADESDSEHEAYYITLEASGDDDDGGELTTGSFKSEIVSAQSSAKDTAGVNLFCDEKIADKKSIKEEEKGTVWNGTAALPCQISSLKEKFRCSLCSSDFAEARSFLAHMSFHYGDDLQTLPPQDNSFTGETESGNKNDNSVDSSKTESLLYNLITATNSYKCSVCEKAFCDHSSLTVHERIHTDDKPYYMYNVLCCKALKESIKLKINQSKHSGEKPYKCTVCGESFDESSNLKIHQQVHFKDKLYKCTDCGKGFNKARSLELHQYTHSGDAPFKCTDCGKSFKYVGTLKSHQRVHSGERPFNCTVCSKSFKQASHLKEHIRIHSEDKPYVCTICSKSFKTPGNLRIHQRLHSGDRPYKCTDCGKAFNQKGHLRVHPCMLFGVRPYKCTVCGKSFSGSATLKIHERIHSEKRP